MGYWSTNAAGNSFADDGSEMLWGDSPADDIDTGMNKLIERLYAETGDMPTVAELDRHKFGEGCAQAPEITEAIAVAKKSFRQGVGRYPTDEEILAGLRFSDSKITLDTR
jgi:hypothetical protein